MNFPKAVLHFAGGAFIACLLMAGDAAYAQSRPCGTSPSDWCAAPEGDPCGRHKTKDACMADKACHGMRYRGESVIACIVDARGFASNCPAVGCISAPRP